MAEKKAPKPTKKPTAEKLAMDLGNRVEIMRHDLIARFERVKTEAERKESETVKDLRESISSLKANIVDLEGRLARALGYIDRVNETEPPVLVEQAAPPVRLQRGPQSQSQFRPDVSTYDRGMDMAGFTRPQTFQPGKRPKMWWDV